MKTRKNTEKIGSRAADPIDALPPRRRRIALRYAPACALGNDDSFDPIGQFVYLGKDAVACKHPVVEEVPLSPVGHQHVEIFMLLLRRKRLGLESLSKLDVRQEARGGRGI